MSDDEPSNDDSAADEPAARETPNTEAESALVQVGDDLAILYGTSVPEGIEVVPFTLIDHTSAERLTDALATVSGALNVAAQGAMGVAQAQGLVRLAPETLKALQTAKPLASGGWNLGTLASEGKIVAQVRWLPAGTVGAAAVVASLGPAVAMVAIQMQLGAISRFAQHNLELTARVLRVVRNQQYADVVGTQTTVMAELQRARDLGSVPEALWSEIRGLRTSLETQADLFGRHLLDHLTKLRSIKSNKARRELLLDEGEAIIADAHALIRVHSTRLVYFALRAGHLLNAGEDQADQRLVQSIIDEARAVNEASLRDLGWLLTQLENEFSIVYELDGKRTFKFGGERKSGRHVVKMVRQLQGALSGLLDQVLTDEVPHVEPPAIGVFKYGTPEDFLKLLRYRLWPGEQMVAAAACNLAGWELGNKESAWLVITSDRVLALRQDDFRRFAAIEREFPISDVRFVRLTERGRDRGPALELVMRESTLSAKFYEWAGKGEQRDQVEALTDVLRTVMHIPESELRNVSLPARPAPIESFRPTGSDRR